MSPPHRVVIVALALWVGLQAGPGWQPLAIAAAGQVVTTEPGVHPVSGRRIADVMSHRGADWLDRPERVQEEQPHRAIAALGLRPGDVVADVGAGTGYYTVRLARAVAPGGQVYATDIQPEMLARLDRRVRDERVRGVTPILATEDDPRLPPGGLDLILMVDVYHELARPQLMLRKLRAALKPGGRLVLIEFRKEDPRVPIRPEHKMSVAEARLELEAEGYQLDRVIGVLPWQHILVFTVARP
jgi:ubiquinone/menaquinone biosynthesis C-methylase UbiE